MQIIQQATELRHNLFTICVVICICSLIIWMADPIFIYGSQAQWIWNILADVPAGWAPGIPQAIEIAGIGSIPQIIITGSAFIVATLIGKNKNLNNMAEARKTALLSSMLLFTAVMIGLTEFSMLQQYYMPMWQKLLFLASESNYTMLWLNIVACFLPKLLLVILSAYAGIISLKVMELKRNAP